MKQLKEILDSLQATSGKLAKQDIIKSNLDNDLFVEVMKFLLNDFVVTGLSSKKINKAVQIMPDADIRSLLRMLDYLSQHNTGTDQDIVNIQMFAHTSDYCELIKSIATKSLKLGVSADTWNKLVPLEHRLPVFDVMLAKNYNEHKDKVIGSFVITKKLDGNRLVCIKENGKVKSFTRTGQPYDGLEDIESELECLSYDNLVFDGELIADAEGSTLDIYAETTSLARSKGKNKKGLIFHIFDVLPVKQFKDGKSKLSAIDRKRQLHDLFTSNDLQYCREVETLYIGNDKSEIQNWLEYSQEQQWEGIMINFDTPYECKRTHNLLKVKVFNTCDLRLIDMEEGSGKYEGMLGALVFDYKGNPMGCGTGLSDNQRKEFWNNKNKYIGQIAEVKFFEESKDSTGKLSLRFPVFLKLRTDKTEPSYN